MNMLATAMASSLVRATSPAAARCLPCPDLGSYSHPTSSLRASPFTQVANTTGECETGYTPYNVTGNTMRMTCNGTSWSGDAYPSCVLNECPALPGEPMGVWTITHTRSDPLYAPSPPVMARITNRTCEIVNGPAVMSTFPVGFGPLTGHADTDRAAHIAARAQCENYCLSSSSSSSNNNNSGSGNFGSNRSSNSGSGNSSSNSSISSRGFDGAVNCAACSLSCVGHRQGEVLAEPTCEWKALSHCGSLVPTSMRCKPHSFALPSLSAAIIEL